MATTAGTTYLKTTFQIATLSVTCFSPNMDSTLPIFGYVLWLVWTCLSMTPTKLQNPFFAMVVTAQDVLEKMMTDSLVTFAPGLIDVLLSDDPPTIAFFKTLPTYATGRWADYLLVLEKPGCRPKIYVGAGTNKDYGVVSRFKNYKNKTSLPGAVKKALDDGYRITFKGLLCWAPIPSAQRRFSTRVLFYAMEAAFSIALWAMQSKTKDYGMPHLCRWSPEDLEYDGLCTHISLADTIKGEEEGLTPEQINAKLAETELRQAEQRKAKYEREKTENFTEWQAKNHRNYLKAGHEKTAAWNTKAKAKAKASGKYFCEPCKANFHSPAALNDHKTTKKHINNTKPSSKVFKHTDIKARADANRKAKKFYCPTCNMAFGNKQQLGVHLDSQRHKNKVSASKTTKTDPVDSGVELDDEDMLDMLDDGVESSY